MRRKLVGGLALVALGSTLLFAKQGTVTTKTGQVYKGDITETPESVEISGVQGESGPVTVRRANVDTVQYPEEVIAEIKAARTRIDRKDVKTRINLAARAKQVGAYELAKELLEEAAKIEPDNQDVGAQLAEVKTLIPAPPKPPTTNPVVTTRPVETVKPVADGIPDGPFIVKRPITQPEINRIRQLEWHADPSGPVHLRIDPEVRRKFLAGYVDLTTAQFSQLSPEDQATLILTEADKKEKDNLLTAATRLRSGVTINTDPISVANFKKAVNHVVVQSCGSSNCHGGAKAGKFSLLTATNDAGVYTNYLVLQMYSYTVDKKQRSLVDRDYPDTSLLLQFMLPADVADTPHPKAANFHAAAKTKSDPRYAQVSDWIHSLNPPTPRYGIDLSKEPPAPPVDPAKTENK